MFFYSVFSSSFFLFFSFFWYNFVDVVGVVFGEMEPERDSDQSAFASSANDRRRPSKPLCSPHQQSDINLLLC